MITKSFLIFVFFLTFFIDGFAKEKTFTVMCHIEDNFTHEQLQGEITVMYGDSVVRSVKAWGYGETSVTIKGNPGEIFTLIADCEGHESDVMQFSVPGGRLDRVNHVFLLQKNRKVQLDDVTVTATKVKMVLRGDTVVYDADAFQLSDGSMLDALISILPGVELKDGVMRVNGRYISSLLLNGEDFFKGDPSVALTNLPAFMVKNVKVYGKESDHAYISGNKSETEKPLVMDVILKRDYALGWIGNLEGGYGMPKRRWIGRGFLLGFADNVRVTAFANANNINDVSSAGTNGNWNGGNGASGDNKIIRSGIDYLYHNKSKPVKVNGNILFARSDGSTLTETSQTNFFPLGNKWQRQRESAYNREMNLTTEHTFLMQKPSFYVSVTPTVSYKADKVKTQIFSSTFNVDPRDSYRLSSLDSLMSGNASVGLQNAVDYVYRRSNWAKERELKAEIRGLSYISISNSPDYVYIEVDGKYGRNRVVDNAEYSMYYPAEPDRNDASRQSHRLVSPSVGVNASLTYGMNFPANSYGGKFELQYTAKYKFDNGRDDNKWFNMQELSSTRERIATELDSRNSYMRREHTNSPSAEVKAEYRIEKFNIEKMARSVYLFKMSVENRINLSALNNFADVNERLRRTSNHILPKVGFNYSHNTASSISTLIMNYEFSQKDAPLAYRLNYKYNYDPLNTYISNANMHKANMHVATLNYARIWNRTKRNLGVALAWRLTNNAIVNAKYYDVSSGINYWRPQNVNGNWSAEASISFNTPIDSERKFDLSTKTSYRFENSVDYATTSAELKRNSVRNNTVAENIVISWQNGGYRLSASCMATLRHASSPSAYFKSLNLFDVSPSFEAIVPLPGDFQISTSIASYMRRGYSDKSMNTNTCVWNLSVNKSLLRNRLTLKIEGYDLLGQINPITTTLNSQALTEVYTSTLSRYVMLCVGYRFNISPKKR